MRVPRAAAVLVLVAGCLTACTPPKKPILGLTAPDGRPTAVLVSCGGFTTVSVYRNDAEAPPMTGAGSGWRTTADHTPAGVIEIPLLGPPPAGWSLSGTADMRLEPGVPYSLGGTAGEDAIPVDFTAGDLDRIPAGSVLTVNHDRDERIVDRDTFETDAKDACS